MLSKKLKSHDVATVIVLIELQVGLCVAILVAMVLINNNIKPQNDLVAIVQAQSLLTPTVTPTIINEQPPQHTTTPSEPTATATTVVQATYTPPAIPKSGPFNLRHSKSQQTIMPHATVVYYEIVASTGDELNTQLYTLGPYGPYGHQWAAVAKWDINWDIPVNDDGSCRFDEMTFLSDIYVVLPHWTPPEGTSPDLIEKWEYFIKKLIEHEQGHVDIIVQNFPLVENAIKQSSCSTANRNGRNMLKEIQRLNDEYDAVTGHGDTQGVVRLW
ncbi:MAG: hypothetical protein B6242_16940 [Anaerolineaceae bacterium 4572_78]|nr:MAG: hypothetical protein B6242_16940 [Anaerolineaceae bacterium 4572_78]